jgi:hypothetical protein
MPCTACGKSGHNAGACWQKVVCHACGKRGHKADVCILPSADEKENAWPHGAAPYRDAATSSYARIAADGAAVSVAIPVDAAAAAAAAVDGVLVRPGAHTLACAPLGAPCSCTHGLPLPTWVHAIRNPDFAADPRWPYRGEEAVLECLAAFLRAPGGGGLSDVPARVLGAAAAQLAHCHPLAPRAAGAHEGVTYCDGCGRDDARVEVPQECAPCDFALCAACLALRGALGPPPPPAAVRPGRSGKWLFSAAAEHAPAAWRALCGLIASGALGERVSAKASTAPGKKAIMVYSDDAGDETAVLASLAALWGGGLAALPPAARRDLVFKTDAATERDDFLRTKNRCRHRYDYEAVQGADPADPSALLVVGFNRGPRWASGAVATIARSGGGGGGGGGGEAWVVRTPAAPLGAANGAPVCNACSAYGHTRRECTRRPQSSAEFRAEFE